MAKGLCPKCGDPVHKNYSYCRRCFNAWQNARYHAGLFRPLSPEQKAAQLQWGRARIARMTPEEKAAYLQRKRESAKRWKASDPQIMVRLREAARRSRAKWTPERREQQRATQKAHYQRAILRAANGLCAYSVRCNEPPAGKQKFCLRHWIHGIRQADLRLEPQYTEEELLSLWITQAGKCSITGVDIIPGDTATLDHIVPVARGGTSIISNIRFVHLVVNRMKWDLSDDEFKMIATQIASPLAEWAKRVS